MARPGRLPSPAMLIALVALIIALGGTSYAAISLPKNSVGTKQIRKRAVTKSKIRPNAITSSKVKNRSLLAKDFKAGQLPAGPKGDKGDKGDAGRSALSSLQSGDVESGAFGLEEAGAAGNLHGALVSFPIALPAAISGTNVHFITGVSGANCPGAGQADPGHLCFYRTYESGVTGSPTFFQLNGLTSGASPNGTLLQFSQTAGTTAVVLGTWTYHA
jgi:hypothetical protein